ncbi:hypothetical protein [Kistimonas asteriae]|uniref:hypothetical protein n=1 Tax=Kistimonas asteriae TaxID=517724 RepID=UPI001BA96A17|nr:hypothetical protein [Kistimonas asteriae]
MDRSKVLSSTPNPDVAHSQPGTSSEASEKYLCGSYGCRSVFKVDQPGTYLMHCLAMHTGKLSNQYIVCLVECKNGAGKPRHCGCEVEMDGFPSHLRDAHGFCVPTSQQIRDMRAEPIKRSRADEGGTRVTKRRKAVTSTTVLSAQSQPILQSHPVVRFPRVLQLPQILPLSQVVQPPLVSQSQSVVRLQGALVSPQAALCPQFQQSPRAQQSPQAQQSLQGSLPGQLQLSSLAVMPTLSDAIGPLAQSGLIALAYRHNSLLNSSVATVSAPQTLSAVRSLGAQSVKKQQDTVTQPSEYEAGGASVQVTQQSENSNEPFRIKSLIHCGSLHCSHEYGNLEKCLSHMKKEHVTSLGGHDFCFVDNSDSGYCGASFDDGMKDEHLIKHINDRRNGKRLP